MVKEYTFVNFFRIFGVKVRHWKIFEIVRRLSDSSKFHRDTLLKISKIFLKCTLTSKILKKFMVIYGIMVHFSEFFRNFWSQCALSNLKNSFFCFYFFQTHISSKNSKKNSENGIILLWMTMTFFRIFGGNVRLGKIFEISLIGCRDVSMNSTIYIDNFNDFSEAHINSKNSEEIHRSVMVKVISNLKFSAVFKSVIKNRGYYWKYKHFNHSRYPLVPGLLDHPV